jgi:hypothetical protein
LHKATEHEVLHRDTESGVYLAWYEGINRIQILSEDLERTLGTFAPEEVGLRVPRDAGMAAAVIRQAIRDPATHYGIKAGLWL